MAGGTDEKGLIRALIAGIAANSGIGLVKLLAWFFTGSAAMLAESLHSFADSSNQGLLALGLRRARRAPSPEHPFGYGKERYFWSFVVALLIFAMGAVFAIYEGISKLLHPHPITNPAWIYVALGCGLVFETYALRIAWREFREYRERHPGPLIQGLRDTKDPTLPTVLFEDTAALVGLLIALVGATTALITGNPVYDAVASILIGVVLLGVSWFLARESFSLLVGEGAHPIEELAIREVAAADPSVEEVVELLTLQRSPRHLLVALQLEFRDDLRTGDIERAVKRIEADIRRRVPTATHIFVEAGSFPENPEPEAP